MKKFLRNKIDLIKRNFQKGEKFEKFAPAVNAFDTFLFVPNHTTQSGSHIRDAVDLKRTMILVVLALLPAFFFGTYNVGLQSPDVINKDFLNCFIYGLKIVLPMYLVVFAVGGLFEALFAVIRGH